MAELAYVNGVFGPLAEARVSIEDRGFQFGDGVYEVVAAYNGRPFLLEQHVARCRRSAAAIGLEYDFDAEPLEPIITQGLTRCDIAGDAMVYIQLTRGASARSHVIPERIKPTVVMTFKPMPKVPGELQRRGAKLLTTRETRWSNCYIKAITLLPNVLAKNEALRRGYDDAIFVTDSGEVRECTSSNLFIVDAEGIKIPPRTESILHGVTQAVLMECAAAIGLTVKERVFDVRTLLRADEAFMSSTTVEVLAVTSVDDHPIGDGCAGPTTRRLYDAFKAQIRAVTAEAMEKPLAGS